MEKLLDDVSRHCMRALECLMVVMMAGMLILVGINVLLRIFANSGIDFAEEVPRFMFVWLIFCGAVVASRERTHIAVNLFVLWSPRPLQKLFYAVTELLVLVCGIYITYGTITLHTIIYENASPVLQISTLWVYGVTYIAGPGLTIIALCNLIRLALNQVPDLELSGRREDPDQPVQPVQPATESAPTEHGRGDGGERQ